MAKDEHFALAASQRAEKESERVVIGDAVLEGVAWRGAYARAGHVKRTDEAPARGAQSAGTRGSSGAVGSIRRAADWPLRSTGTCSVAAARPITGMST